MKRSLIQIITTLCLFLLCVTMQLGCSGGGSEGTGGLARTVQGVVTTPEGAPVSGATVTIISTGDTTLTNEQGEFALITTDDASELELEIRKDDDVATTAISTLGGDSQSVQVTIEFDPTTSTAVPVEDLEVSVKIVGMCDSYFENNRVIRQANAVPAGTECTAKIVTTTKGKPIGNIGYALSYKGCSENAPSTLVGAGLTSVVFNPGVGQITFPYFDDAVHCVYEVQVPYGAGVKNPVVYKIVTFTKQRQ